MAAPPWLKSDESSQKSPYIFDAAQEQEHRRLELQSSAINTLMRGKPIHARLQKPRRILEIGCGTGHMTDFLARAFPDSVVYAVDPQPVPLIRKKPANVEYIQGKFDDLLENGDSRLQPGSFDYIFSRMLAYVVTDWDKYMSRAITLLAPGGWIEQQELDFYTHYTASSPDEDVGREWEWPAILRGGMAATSLIASAGSNLPKAMSGAGLANVESAHFPFALTPWPERPETEEMVRYTTLYVPPTCKALLRRICASSHSNEEIERMCRDIDDKLLDNGIEGLHLRWSTCIGRKE